MAERAGRVQVGVVGECMIELRHVDRRTLHVGYAGDTLNTAVYLARCLGTSGQVHYVTAVGDDSYSDDMVARWVDEGILVDRVARVPGSSPGLYLIRVDASGERSFTYYRSESPARRLFDPVEPPGSGDLADFDAVYLSGITLSVLSEAGRERVWAMLGAARRSGTTVAFDTNYRAAGWPDPVTARDAVTRTLRRTDIALPTFDDERALFGDDGPEASIRRLRDLGVGEIVLKLGANGCLVAGAGRHERVSAQPVEAVVDTTAAGDSFNGAYLAARLSGRDPVAAAREGNRLAGVVIGHGGAITPRSTPSR